MTPIAVTIAGSDSGGGAGIQADLKTFSALGVYGASVITVLTAQNTQGVTGIHDVPAHFIAAQIDAVAQIARAVATLEIARACRGRGAAGILRRAGRDQKASVVLDHAIELASETGHAIDLAGAAIAVLAGGCHADAVRIASVAVSTFRRALATRHTRAGHALKLATAVRCAAAVIAQRTATCGAAREDHEGDQ